MCCLCFLFTSSGSPRMAMKASWSSCRSSLDVLSLGVRCLLEWVGRSWRRLHGGVVVFAPAFAFAFAWTYICAFSFSFWGSVGFFSFFCLFFPFFPVLIVFFRGA